MASSHVHNMWKYTQIFPAAYLARKESGGIEEYLDLYNVSSVFAHEAEWIEYFSHRSEQYEKVWHGGKFDLFLRRGYSSNYLLEGDASILEVMQNGVRLKMNSQSAVIKFTYYSFLEAPPCKVTPFEVSESIKFVKLAECPIGSEVTLKAGSVLRRIGLR